MRPGGSWLASLPLVCTFLGVAACAVTDAPLSVDTYDVRRVNTGVRWHASPYSFASTPPIQDLVGFAVAVHQEPNPDVEYGLEAGFSISDAEWTGWYVDDWGPVGIATFATDFYELWGGYRLDGMHPWGHTYLSGGLTAMQATSHMKTNWGSFNETQLERVFGVGAYVAAGYTLQVGGFELFYEVRQGRKLRHKVIELHDMDLPYTTVSWGARLGF